MKVTNKDGKEKHQQDMYKEHEKKKSKDKFYTGIAVVILLLLWQLIAMWVGWDVIVPSPIDTMEELFDILSSETFVTTILSTIIRTFAGFSISLLAGAVLAGLAAYVKPVEYLLKPLILTVRSVPTMAIILMALIWLTSNLVPVFVGFLVIFPIVYTNLLTGIKSVDKKLVEMGKIYKFGKGKMVREIYIPSLEPYFQSTVVSGLGLNLKVVIAAEVLSQPAFSVGTSLLTAKAGVNMAGVFAWAIIVIVIAYLMDQLLKWVFRNKRKRAKDGKFA